MVQKVALTKNFKTTTSRESQLQVEATTIRNKFEILINKIARCKIILIKEDRNERNEETIKIFRKE